MVTTQSNNNQENWKDIHEDFAEKIIDDNIGQKITLQQLWERWGFTFAEMKQLVDSGLHPEEVCFGIWLKDQINEIRSKPSLNAKELRKEYQQVWANIHSGFTEKNRRYEKTYQEIWENWNLTYKSAQKWISAGFTPTEYEKINKWGYYKFTSQEVKSWIDTGFDKSDDPEFAAYLRGKGHRPSSGLNLEQLRTEYENWSKSKKPAQKIPWHYLS